MTFVETTTGGLSGVERGAHLAYLGVPYAAPTGDRRFLAPAPVAPWSGVRAATTIGLVAPQDPLVPPPFRAETAEGEDCLSLNVFTPAVDGGKRPVLFWIHGGGFSHGGGSQPAYDGGPLAERGDVVVVTINYRLGALGYLCLDHVGGGAWGASPNVGQLDQIQALEWVRDNIAAFGGDPGNVTIFGQSAGAAAVATLLAMPAARGLFHKAVAQSGTANRLGGLDVAATIADRYLERLGIPDGDGAALRAASVGDLLAAQGPRGALRPVVDGVSLPVNPIEAVADGFAAGIPLMVGTARDEAKLYIRGPRPEIDARQLEDQVRSSLPRRAGDRASEVVAIYQASRAERRLPASPHDIVDAVSTASRFRWPALRLAETQQAHQPATFVYQVDWESPARGGALGACHGIEIPFVFGTLGRPELSSMGGSGPEAERLAGQMMDAWIAFARSGDPSHDGIGSWPGYTTADRPTMIFGQTTAALAAPFEEERALWQSLTHERERSVS